MQRVDALLSVIERVYGERAPEREVASALLSFLAEKSPRHITFQLVRDVVPGGAHGALDAAIARTLQYLSGDGAGVLRLRFEFLDGHDIPHALDEVEVKTAMTDDVNPLTGERDPDVRRRLIPYFEPTEDLKPLAGTGQP